MESKFEFAKELVKKAGQYILDHMQEDLRVETKSSPTDLVTRLDKEVQELLVSEIFSRYPEDKICAEEGCLRASIQEGKVWVIDPIDGTNNFVAQQEDFAVMMAYLKMVEDSLVLFMMWSKGIVITVVELFQFV